MVLCTSPSSLLAGTCLLPRASGPGQQEVECRSDFPLSLPLGQELAREQRKQDSRVLVHSNHGHCNLERHRSIFSVAQSMNGEEQRVVLGPPGRAFSRAVWLGEAFPPSPFPDTMPSSDSQTGIVFCGSSLTSYLGVTAPPFSR